MSTKLFGLPSADCTTYSTLDALCGWLLTIVDTANEKPSEGHVGNLCFVKDSDQLYRWGTNGWTEVGGAGGGGTDPFATKVAVLANDASTGANTTPIDVPGLVFDFAANSIYVIEVFGRRSAAAASTGMGLQINVSTPVVYADITFFHQLANTGTLSGGHAIADDASVGVSSGVPGTAIYPFYASGVLKTGVGLGTAQLRYRSEVAAVSTIRAGTVMRVHKVA